jgi:hypothetical protein
VLRDMLSVTCACGYSIWMPILTDNRYDIAVENLASALLTPMLTGTLIYLVDVANGALHAPRSIQTSPRLSRKNCAGTDCPNHPRYCRTNCSSGYLHIASVVSLAVRLTATPEPRHHLSLRQILGAAWEEHLPSFEPQIDS